MNTEEQPTTKSSAPTYYAYQVRSANNQKYYNRIGAAFAHRDGRGLFLILDAVPLDGQISLRLPTENQ